MYIYRLLLKYTKEKIQTWRCLCIQLSLIWRTAVKAWMTVRSPTFFFAPDTVCHLPRVHSPKGLVHTGSVRSYLMYEQYTMVYHRCCVKDNAFLVIGSQICKILKIWTVHCLHLLIHPFLRSKQLHLNIIIAIFKTVQLPKSK